MQHALPIFNELSFFYGDAFSSFVGRKTWLVRESALRRLPIARRPAVRRFPCFTHRRLLHLWLRTWKRERSELPSSAEAIQFSRDGLRVRAFDLARNRSYKIVTEDSRYGAGTHNETRIRRDVLPGSGVTFPAIHAMYARGPFLFLEEDLVQGRPWSIHADGRRFRETVAVPLMRLYEHHGISTRPLSAALDGSVLRAAEQIDDTLPLGQHLRRLIRRDPLVATGLCHGDLVPSNLAVGAEGVVFLDWEKAADGILGSDFVDIARKYHRHRAITGAARRVFEIYQKDRLSFEDGLALFYLQAQAAQEYPDWRAASDEWTSRRA